MKEFFQKKVVGSGSDVSELRQDLLTGDWVVIASGRARRPESFRVPESEKVSYDPEKDPFNDPEASGNDPDVLIYRTEDDWSTRVFPNKYPAFFPDIPLEQCGEGPYFAVTGQGSHELVVTRDGQKHFALLSREALAEVFDAYQERYLSLMTRRGVRSVNIIHNHGPRAGASVSHPHSQIFAIPVIPSVLRREITSCASFWRQNRVSVFSTIVEYESVVGRRVVYENDEFIAYCPFASERAFEVRVMPKTPKPYFERITNSQKFSLADVFGRALFSLHKALDNPDYNFYIRSAPCDGQDYRYYSWHIDILPYTNVPAGFEFSTGIEVSTISPERSAEYLRDALAGIS
ncbi:MAG: DUF4921 family protein [Candidatus Moranbacteria bacterium]|nr:DUF4921 family protein [Candidatus Moranbacteria bacterium]